MNYKQRNGFLMILAGAFFILVPDPQVGASMLLVSNEKGNSISLLNTSTGVVTPYATGLSNPDGIAFSPDGSLYATSFGGNTVSRVTPPGTFVTVASGFTGPGAMAIGPTGIIYVPNFSTSSTQTGGTTVAKLTPDGSGGFTAATLAMGLNTPDGLAFDSHGVLYEADFGSNRINKIDVTSGAVTPFVANTAGLSNPSGIVFDSQDNLYVANYANGVVGSGSVSKISSGGAVTNNFVTGLNSPLGILLVPADNVFYVSSWNGNTVSSFPLNGGSATQVAVGLNGPTHMLALPEPSIFSIVGLAGGAMLLSRRRESQRM